MRLGIITILACSLTLLVSCSGNSTSETEPVNSTPVWHSELPALPGLDATPTRIASDIASAVDGWPGTGYTSSNATQASNSVILQSGETELSYALYGYKPAHYSADVPFLAPYQLHIDAEGTGEYWIALADYNADCWHFEPEPVNAASATPTTVHVSLDSNSANAAGTCWFAIVAYGGNAPQINEIVLDYPDVPVIGQPVDYHQFITASDGVQLATDVYLPYAETSAAIPDPPYPVLLMRTPYNKNYIASWIVPTLTQANIAVVIQYFRGRLENEPVGGWPEDWPYSWPDSTGTEYMFTDHAGPHHFDAVDTVEWIESRPWYNGDLILSGSSALAGWIYQAQTLLGNRVTAVYPQMCAADFGEWAVRENGCYKQSNVDVWINNNDYPANFIDTIEANLEVDTYWERWNFNAGAGNVRSPGYHETGWWDLNIDATIETWRKLQYNGGAGASGYQWLIIGPWTHNAARATSVGDLTFPDDNTLHDPGLLPQGWDGTFWIIDKIGRLSTPFTEPDSHVLIYIPGHTGYTVSGTNQWIELHTWPPEPSDERVRYLNSSGTGFSLVGTPQADNSETLTADPANPVPTIGGANLEFPGTIEAGPYAQDSLLGRDDVLEFWNTDDLGSGTVLYVGVPRLVLFVSTEAADTDICVKLLSTEDPGPTVLICDTCVRLSNYLAEHGMGDVVPGQIYELEIELPSMAWSFYFTDEVHLAIQGTNYPRFAINPGNGDTLYDGTNGLVQTNTLYYGETYPSRLILPEYEP